MFVKSTPIPNGVGISLLFSMQEQASPLPLREKRPSFFLFGIPLDTIPRFYDGRLFRSLRPFAPEGPDPAGCIWRGPIFPFSLFSLSPRVRVEGPKRKTESGAVGLWTLTEYGTA